MSTIKDRLDRGVTLPPLQSPQLLLRTHESLSRRGDSQPTMERTASLRAGWLLLLALTLTACTGATEPTTAPSFPTTSLVTDNGSPTDASPLIWTQISHSEALGGQSRQVMLSVTAGGPGLVAVGWDESSGDEDAAVWTSPDGIIWTRVPDSDDLGGEGGQRMLNVTAGGPGLVAVGWDESSGDQKAAVWTSSDGIIWTRVPDSDDPDGEGSEVMLSVTTGGPGLVAVGLHVPGGDQNAAVWTSPDGIIWTRAPDSDDLGGEGGQRMLSVTTVGPGLVAVGLHVPGVNQNAAVWTSPDGIIWTRAPDSEALGGQSRQVMLSVTKGGPGLVAVGWDESSGDQKAAVWTSSDGIIWTRSPDNDDLGGEGSQRMLSVTAGGPGLVAVGQEGSGTGEDAAVWTATTSPGKLVEPEVQLGVPIGPSRLPAELYMTPFTSTKLSFGPDDAVTQLEEAQRSGMRVFVVLVGAQRHYRKGNGTFDLELWKGRVDRFRGIDFERFVEDGTILAHQLVSEGKARSEWGGEVISNDVLDEMARYSKEIWPTMSTVLRTDATDLEEHAAAYSTPLPEWKWIYLDAAWSRYLVRKGPVDEFAFAEQASADRQGLALVVGLNVFSGGDGSSGIPSPAEGKWAMSGEEVIRYGGSLLLLTRSCAFGMWRYETEGSEYEDYRYFRRLEMLTAMNQLTFQAAQRPTLPCH